MSSPSHTALSPELSHVRRLRSGLAIMIVVALAVLAIVIALVVWLIARAGLLASSATPSSLMSLVVMVYVMIVATAAVGIVADAVALLRLRSGFEGLRALGRGSGIGSTGSLLLLIGLALSLVPYLNLIGGLLLLASNVLIGINLYELGKSYNNSTLTIGGVLTAIPIISLVGIIISYIALGSVERSLASQQLSGAPAQAVAGP